MSIDEIYERMIKVSGPHSNLQNINIDRDGKEIYGSYHFSQFNKTNSVRNTLLRFKEFKINSLKNKRVFDIGSNLGSLSFEALRRGADEVVGFEYCAERVNLCNELKEELGLNGKFLQLNIEENLDPKKFIADHGRADIVFCCSFDAYTKDRKALYRLISELTLDTCYFETNSNIKSAEFVDIMKSLGFMLVLSLGTSKSDAGCGRKSYILIKDPQIVINSVRKNDKQKLYDHVVYRWNEYYLTQYFNKDTYKKLRSNYSRINGVRGVQSLEFYDCIAISPEYKRNLSECKFSKEEKEDIKLQLVSLIRELNSRKLAHRDLHIKNAFYHDGELVIIDWEFLESNDVDILDAYDLTGCGMPSPLQTGNMNVFSSHRLSFSNFLDSNISLDDFLPVSSTRDAV